MLGVALLSFCIIVYSVVFFQHSIIARLLLHISFVNLYIKKYKHKVEHVLCNDIEELGGKLSS